jgi:hypothetical protein
MGQFMREEVSALCGFRGISSGGKANVPADRVSLSIDGLGRFTSTRTIVDADCTKVMIETGFHVALGYPIQWPASATAQYRPDHWR